MICIKGRKATDVYLEILSLYSLLKEMEYDRVQVILPHQNDYDSLNEICKRNKKLSYRTQKVYF